MSNFPSSAETYQRMLTCQTGDVFHEMFSFVVRVRSINSKVVVTEHFGMSPFANEIRFFGDRKDFAKYYAYKSSEMSGKSTLRWSPKGFATNGSLECICLSNDLLNHGCQCGTTKS